MLMTISSMHLRYQSEVRMNQLKEIYQEYDRHLDDDTDLHKIIAKQRKENGL